MTDAIYIPEGPVVVISRSEYERLHVHEQVGSRQRIAALREDRDRQRTALAHAVAERDRLRGDLHRAVEERDRAVFQRDEVAKKFEAVAERASLLLPLTRGQARHYGGEQLIAHLHKWLVG